MLQLIVRADHRRSTQRITIPKIIRDAKGWNHVLLYRLTLNDDNTVTLEEYMNSRAFKVISGNH